MTDKTVVSEVSDMTNQNKTIDPVATGDTHANRIADNGGSAEAMPTLDTKNGPSSKAEIIMYTADYIAGLNNDNAVAFYDRIVADIKSKDATYTGGTKASTTAMASLATKEDLELVFAGDESLSEDFKTKATTIFEAAVSAAITVEKAKLEEANEVKIVAAASEVRESLTKRVGDFLDYMAESFVKENKVAIETNIRTEAVDSFLGGLKGLFAEHYVDIPADKVDVVESLTVENEALEGKLDEETAKNIALHSELRTLKAAAVLESKLEGLTDTQKDKFRALAGVYESGPLDAYEAKLTTIAEAVAVKTTPVLNEDITVSAVEPEATRAAVLDPQMQMFVDAIKRTANR